MTNEIKFENFGVSRSMTTEVSLERLVQLYVNYRLVWRGL